MGYREYKGFSQPPGPLNGPGGPEREAVILASTSPRRAELLRQIGVRHVVVPPVVDESFGTGRPPEDIVRELAARKAESVCGQFRDRLVVAADTLLYLDRLMGKPAGAEDARTMLRALSGKTHRVFTGVAVCRGPNGPVRTGVSSASVRLRRMDEREIDGYVRTGEPLDKAGAYAVQGLGARYVEEVCGDFYAVVGLPLSLTALLLEGFGYRFGPPDPAPEDREGDGA